MYSRVIVQPPVEPLTVAEVKLDRGIDHSLHDDLLSALIRTAREYVEGYCQLSLVTQTRETSYDSFTGTLELPYGPVQEIVSVEYAGGSGSPQAISDYQSNIHGAVASISPAYGGMWPTAVGASVNAVTVRYVCGYAPAEGSPTDYTANIPGSFKTAMKLLVGNWYENREATVAAGINGVGAPELLPLGVEAVLFPYRIRRGMA